jgi:hypothetical protein
MGAASVTVAAAFIAAMGPPSEGSVYTSIAPTYRLIGEPQQSFFPAWAYTAYDPFTPTSVISSIIIVMRT